MKYVFYAFVFFTLSSCGVKKYQDIPYLLDVSEDSVHSELAKLPPILKIQKGDAFTMDVSSQNSAASALFSNDGSSGVASMETGSASLKSFQVDNQGNIRIPLAGSIKIEGLTLIDAREKIETELKTYLKDPVVNLKLTNFRISVIGDVAKPGAYVVEDDKINILEVIALAGDLNLTAQRKNILLVRINDGKKTYARMDIQSKKIMDSPYFYLKSGDILYVQPGEAAYARIDNRYQNLGVFLSVISLAALLYTQLVR